MSLDLFPTISGGWLAPRHKLPCALHVETRRAVNTVSHMGFQDGFDSRNYLNLTNEWFWPLAVWT